MDPTSLAPGTTIGHYVLERLVAVGGSAAVYAARDPMACRTVAIKLLLDHHGAEGARRLLHEARAYSRLVHPRIVTLYEVTEHEGRAALVLEWVDGVTLAERLASGPLGETECLGVMAQVADGLSAAHALGVAHRDLKPANIMLTPDGGVKLLDFGLAKPVANGTALPQSWVTVDGAILGTPAYMSPEQVRGEELSLASDVFSFGAVLHELLSGSPAFARESTIETLNAVAGATTRRLSRRGGTIKRALVRLSERCLMANPNQRPRDARELVVELDRIGRGTRPWTPRGHGRWMAAAALITALAVVGAAWLAPRWRSQLRSAMGGAIVLPVDGQLPVLLDDGGAVAFVSVDGREIWVAPVGEGNPELVWAGRENIHSLVVAPDERTLLFASTASDESWVWQVSVDGGLPRKLTRGSLMAVAPDGDTIAAIRRVSPQRFELVLCDTDGTARRRLAVFDGSMVPKACGFLPGGDVLVVLTDGLRLSRLVSVSADGDEQHVLAEQPRIAAAGVAVVPDLRVALWCLRSSRAMPTMLCATSLVNGATRAVYPGPGEASNPAVAGDGSRLVFQVQRRSMELAEVVLERQRGEPASSVHVLPGTRGATQPRLSPDGRMLAFQSGRGDLWVMDRTTGSSGPLLTTGVAAFNPAWSPDGRLIAYSSIKNGRSALWLARADGGDPHPLTDGASNCFQPVWHPAGRSLFFISDRDGAEDLYRLHIDSGAVERVNHDGAANPALSPDGRMLAIAVPQTGARTLLRLLVLDKDGRPQALAWERSMLASLDFHGSETG